MHKDTCFKYVTDKAVRFAKHCRFHFCHFVALCLRAVAHAASQQGERLRDVTLARTGKDLVLPRSPGDEALDMHPRDAQGLRVPLRPTCQLGPTVVADPDHGNDGCA